MSFFRNVRLGRGVGVVGARANAVDLLVELGTVVVSVLTSTSNREHDLGRMPCTDTSNLAQTLVSLSRQLLGSPSMSNTLESVTLGNGDNINTLVLLEHRANLDRLLEQAVGELDLVRD